MSQPTDATPITAELRIAKQLARLFRRSDSPVWELVDLPACRQADDVTIRDVDGTPVAYARPATS
jgi:hypothetical protein